MKVVIIDYGVGNIKSIQFAFERLGISAIYSHNLEEIINADKIILPGVGEASNAMRKLKEKALDKVIANLKQPTLGICVGMQLLCTSSEEGNMKGLDVFKVKIKKFDTSVKIPHVGWNTISNLKTPLFKGIKEKSYIYSTHSYCAPLCEHTIAEIKYGKSFSCALHHQNFYGVQFHPEKSGLVGSNILKAFLNL